MKDSRNGSILVIEDDRALIELFKAILKQAGFEYYSATSPGDAQKLLDDRPFDALVCDLSVAGGAKIFDLIHDIRAQHPETAVLIVTGFTPEEIASKIASQNVELMEKPFTPADLVGRLRTMVNYRAA